MANKRISPERQNIYYAGMAIGVVGALTFFSVFVSGALHFGDFSDFHGRVGSMALRAVLGMAMLIGGGILMNLGKMGAAGSGLKLDPEKAREDVEPWARMTGGVVKDALDEAGIKFGQGDSPAQLPFDEKLRRLEKLRADGLLNQAEFEATKKKILESA
jgi:hypothetical protein